ncbi:MAG TPA: SusC/RagA family TonB-linked outer membrane protein [Puia sp.]|uniref:SusC/RagA family TonB-linked outer membrane protein n=1 Tax=Puia sp. TaxID=2045100 RepID=UPI002BAAE1EC|nr:SusC/RagA family TonB-linked outer membrane protein [Puia sp.]HVU94345.1 SusC/RagA family TonB-linked outer membrane protein [Puia sp.]
MKLTALIVLVGCIHVSARTNAQKITLSARNESLVDIFEEIRHQAGYEFLCNVYALQKAAPVTVEVRNAPVEEVLAKIFRDQPLTWSILNGKTIVVKEKVAPPPAAPDTFHLSAAVDVIGIVQNERGQPLAGATVAVKGRSKGTVTNENGLFILKGVAVKSQLVISFIGYTSEGMTVDETPRLLTVTLKIAANELDQSVVQAYGLTSQRLTTGNIARVSAEEIGKQPVMNPLLALQGRVAGMVVTPTTGYASGVVKVEIRGRNTINPGITSDPLYIIDGVPLTVLEVYGSSSYQTGSSGFLQSIGSFSPAGGQSPLFSLNPADIESIEVLKDADATAIYGSRGANGVILITTKKGSAGKTKFNLNLTQGTSAVTKRWAMLNTPQYLQMRREAFRNDGIAPTPGNAPDLLLWDTTRYTNWQGQLWGGMGQVSNLQAELTGGDDRTVFRLGADYSRTTDVLTKSGANQRASLSFNLNHHSLNQKLTLSLTANYSYALINNIFTASATYLAPDAPAIYNSAGGLNYAPWDSAGIGYAYPFNSLLSPYTSHTNFLQSSLLLGYNLAKGFNVKLSLGYNNTDVGTSLLETIASRDPATNPTGSAVFSDNKNGNWIIEPQLTYNRFIGPGKLSFLAGATEQFSQTDGTSSYGLGYTNDAFIRSIANAPVVLNGESYAQYKYAGIFTSINYNWGNKYILDLVGRRDGSSRFGPGRQYGNFGSVGAAWIVSEENWFKKALPAAISFVKLRGSYGLTGSDGVGDYQYLSQWGTSPIVGSTPLYTYGGVTPLVNTHAVDQDYHWQVNKKLEGALKLGFLKDSRFDMEVSYYQNRCGDQLLQYPTAAFTGFTAVTANWPANVQNNGWEIVLNAGIINGKDFSWIARFNMGINRNRLLSYPGLLNSPFATLYKVGKSLNEKYLLHYTGVDPLTGQYSYLDYNHDGQITTDYGVAPGAADDDRRVTIDLSPAYSGGLGNEFRYKNYSLSFFLQFIKQRGVNAYYGPGVLPGQLGNVSTDIFNSHWQKPGDKAAFARFTTTGTATDQFFQFSDGAYTDASFIRLSNIAFSYALPPASVKKAHLEGCRLFLLAENILLITRYKGIDPTSGYFGALPPPLIFTGGLSLNF